METMRYKPSDRVKIKSLDWYNENKNETYDVEYSNNIRFDRYMSKFCGKVMTISHVGVDYYTMVEDLVGYWTDEMIEGLVEEENESELVPYFEEGTNKILYYKNKNTFECYFPMRTPEYICPDGYQFKDENGNVINATKIVLEKKKKEYPKTYEECCEVLYIIDNKAIWHGYRSVQLKIFQKLLIYRDAYWKIAGDEMGLGKPWEPDWKDGTTHKFIIHTIKDEIRCGVSLVKNHIFSFPTEEMRDAFYENFKELIENCKELL